MSLPISLNDFNAPILTIPFYIMLLILIVLLLIAHFTIKQDDGKLQPTFLQGVFVLCFIFGASLLISYKPFEKAWFGDDELYEQRFVNTETLISNEIANGEDVFLFYTNGRRAKEMIKDIDGIKSLEVKTDKETYLVDVAFNENEQPVIEKSITVASN